MAVRGALLAADAADGAAAGFGYLNTDGRSSYADAYFGFRFYRGFNYQKILFNRHNPTSQRLSALLVVGKII